MKFRNKKSEIPKFPNFKKTERIADSSSCFCFFDESFGRVLTIKKEINVWPPEIGCNVRGLIRLLHAMNRFHQFWVTRQPLRRPLVRVVAMIDKKEIQEISKKTNMSEEKVEKILEEVSKPSLTNTHCSFDDELGVGPSDKAS